MPGNRLTGVYLGSFHFRVTIAQGDPMDGFIRISPIVSETEEMTFKHGMDRVVRKAMGRTVFNEVVLERIYSGRDEFSVWRDQIVLGVEDRRMVKIEYLAPDGRTVIREYDLYNAWPKRWELPPMDAGSSTPAVEKITLSVERVVMAAGTGERTVAEQTQV